MRDILTLEDLPTYLPIARPHHKPFGLDKPRSKPRHKRPWRNRR